MKPEAENIGDGAIGTVTDGRPVKRVAVDELRPGMFICDLNAGWLAHPFLFNQLRLTDASQIEEIRRHGIDAVFIDTRRGDDVAGAPSFAEVVSTTRSQMLDSATRPPATARRVDRAAPGAVAAPGDIQRARQVLALASERLRQAMIDARLGKAIDIPALRESAASVSAAVIRNNSAMALVCRLRRRDEYTFGHSLNVGVLLARFGHHLGYRQETLQQFALGGLLHDVGKMSVDQSILNKPGELSDAEYDAMKTHVSQGLALVDRYALPDATLAVIREHHERSDGSGYPTAAAGEGISETGRMAAIVDVYDAISSDRVYHKALPAPEAMRRIFEWQRHFDPVLVHSFVRCLGIYPAGSLVRLQSERLAVVLGHDPANPIRPHIRVVFDIRRDAPVPPEDIDLAAPRWSGRESIVGHEDPRQWPVDVARAAGC